MRSGSTSSSRAGHSGTTLLRAFEIVTGHSVLRPDMPEFMGAYGAALIAKDREGPGRSSIISKEQLELFEYETETKRCPGCGNNCLLTVTSFGGGRRHVTGNMCSNGENGGAGGAELPPNLYAWKYKRLFEHYVPLSAEDAPRGTGDPRVLNIYEDYPFWFAFTGLGFRWNFLTAARRKPGNRHSCRRRRSASREAGAPTPAELLDRGVKPSFPGVQKERESSRMPAHQLPRGGRISDVAGLNVDGLSHRACTTSTRSFLDAPGRIVEQVVKAVDRYGISCSEAAEAVRRHMRTCRV